MDYLSCINLAAFKNRPKQRRYLKPFDQALGGIFLPVKGHWPRQFYLLVIS